MQYCGIGRRVQLFQSTSPVRGTTRAYAGHCQGYRISIHVPREGDDGVGAGGDAEHGDFNPRPP